jgi:Tfp pilus assembly protein PilV
MAMTVFAIGVTGIAAMQKITLASNLHAKRLAVATHIAQSWQEQLAADAALWTQASVNQNGTQWLSNAGAGWLRAPDNADATFGATFGPLGGYTSTVSESYFCVHIRVTDMSDQRISKLNNEEAVSGNGLLRTEVRVFWPRDGREPASKSHYCDASSGATLDDESYKNFHFVSKVSAVRQST